MSVAANYRSAQRGRSKAEFIAKLGIVIEEADETLFWLEMLQDTGAVPSSKIAPLTKEGSELLRIFVRSRQTAKS